MNVFNIIGKINGKYEIRAISNVQCNIVEFMTVACEGDDITDLFSGIDFITNVQKNADGEFTFVDMGEGNTESKQYETQDDAVIADMQSTNTMVVFHKGEWATL